MRLTESLRAWIAIVASSPVVALALVPTLTLAPISCSHSGRSKPRGRGQVRILSVDSPHTTVVRGQVGIEVRVRIQNGTKQDLLITSVRPHFRDAADADRDPDYFAVPNQGDPNEISAGGEAVFLFFIDVDQNAVRGMISVNAGLDATLAPSGDSVLLLSAKERHQWTVVSGADLILGVPQTPTQFVPAGEIDVPLSASISNAGETTLDLLGVDLTFESRGGRDLSSDLTWRLSGSTPSSLLPGELVNLDFAVSFASDADPEAVIATVSAVGLDSILGDPLQDSATTPAPIWGVVTTILPPFPTDESFDVPAVGDIDGDQIADIVVGSRGSRSGAIDGAGVAYVYYGSNPAVPLVLTQPTPARGNAFGGQVVVADFDADGLDDVAVGAPVTGVWPLQAAGEIVVFFGPDLARVQLVQDPTPTSSAFFGERLATADFNGDGRFDLACGARVSTDGPQGEAFVFYGPDFSVSVRVSPTGLPPDVWFGHQLGAGDLDGDGFADLAVGALGAGVSPLAGEVHVLWGPSLTRGPVLFSPGPVAGAAFSSPAIGDVTGDGLADLVIGAPRETWGGVVESGRAYLFEGPGLTPGFGLPVPSPQRQSLFGFEVRIGDVDGDGTNDVILPAQNGDYQGVTDSGVVHILFGPALDRSITLSAPRLGERDRLGTEVFLYDINADGVVEVFVGADGDTVQGAYPSGAVFVFPVP